MKKNIILPFFLIIVKLSFGQDSTVSVIAKIDDFSNFKSYPNAYPTMKIPLTKNSLKDKTYDEQITLADSLYKNGNFQKSVIQYEIAFKENGNQGRISHRLNAARCYTLINNFNGAFTQLLRIAEKGGYNNNFVLEQDHIFDPLHTDKRWDKVISIVVNNKRNLEKQLTQQLVVPEEN